MEVEINGGATPVRRTWWFRTAVVVMIGGLAIGFWLLSRPPLPDQQQAQRDIATRVGQLENARVTAVCTVPDNTGYTCRLRDSAGRYGFSNTLFVRGKHTFAPKLGTRSYGQTDWGFPLRADGTGTLLLDASPPGDLSTSVTGAVDMISGSLGRPNLISMYGAIHCGAVSEHAVTRCTVHAPVLSATVRRVGDHKYELTYRVALHTP